MSCSCSHLIGRRRRCLYASSRRQPSWRFPAHAGARRRDPEYACAMPSIGPLELGIILLIILVVFGPKRLPGLGRQLGTGMREFKDSITGKDKDDDEERDAFGERTDGPAQTPLDP